MEYLLDTHAVLWYIGEDPQLPAILRRQIEDATNRCYVSIASLWEIGIKSCSGKLSLFTDIEELFISIERSGFVLLPITTEHILLGAKLPLHHNDPFDRMIISQCLAGQLTMVSCDKQFRHYNLPVIWNRSGNC
jgi:PIN domain nuclease of toxin-antitoxin system